MFPLEQNTILQAAFKEWTAKTNRSVPFACWLERQKSVMGLWWGA